VQCRQWPIINQFFLPLLYYLYTGGADLRLNCIYVYYTNIIYIYITDAVHAMAAVYVMRYINEPARCILITRRLQHCYNVIIIILLLQYNVTVWRFKNGGTSSINK